MPRPQWDKQTGQPVSLMANLAFCEW